MKTIIAGSRDFNNYPLLSHVAAQHNITTVISGGARGADALGEQYAIDTKLPLNRFPAQWNKYGNRAGYLRNIEMAKNADALIAFWDGRSRGTYHMIETAKCKGLLVTVIRFDQLPSGAITC